jgi:hypothetical protein
MSNSRHGVLITRPERIAHKAGDDGRVYVGANKHHGIANRSVLPPLLISTGAKPIAQARGAAIALFGYSNLLARRPAPPQFNGLSCI